MRYSRLLEENSFSSRRADYVLLLALCASFLLVSLHPHRQVCPNSLRLGHLTTPYHAFPFLVASILACLHLVEAKSVYQDVAFWDHHVGCRTFTYRNQPDNLFRITAPYLPLCLVGFSWLLQGGFHAAVGDIVSLCHAGQSPRLLQATQVGILAGHTYVFLQDFWPREMWSRTGKGEVRTPAFM